MTNITSGANKRTSNGFGGLPLVPTNTGSRLTRSVGYFENALYKTFTEVVRAPASFVYGADAVSNVLRGAAKAAWKYANTDPNKAQGSSVSNQSPNTKYKNYGKQTGGAGGAGGTKTSIKPPVFNAPPLNPSGDYKFNLPPHQWSLPLDPDAVSPDTVASRSDDYHTTRRGKIWYYNGYVGPSSAPDYQSTGIYTPPANAKGTVNNYGFQFIWNPETFSQHTAVNMSITPAASDPTIALTGFAAANSTMSFTLRLDRTNDFACAKNFVFKDGTFTVPGGGLTVNNGNFQEISKYYGYGNKFVDGFTLEKNIKDLLTYGTEADLEFLYRTINGTGWKGIGGRETSNIGYLMPSLIRLDLGNQKFVGVVADIQVNHLAFTRDLVPIRTDVNITVDLRANIQPTTNNGAVGR
jgi:hypothetical protein